MLASETAISGDRLISIIRPSREQRDETDMTAGSTDQDDVLAFLAAAAGREGAAVERRETHISVVVLAGRLAWKLKRAVKLSYLDFSTPALRLAACERELALNRRTAPGLYRAVRRITRRQDGSLAFDGDGELVDAVVEMNRFDDATLFDTLARRHALTHELLTALARAIAGFHRTAAVGEGGAASISAVIDLNRDALAGSDAFDPAALAAYDGAVRRAFAIAAPGLEARGRAGRVRHCHGDLHLRNICLVDGVPTLFDCIEFDDRLATIDVLYDLAFVLMDLWHRGEAAAANWLFNRYLDDGDETDGLPLLPLFMSLRAAVRAHVVAAQARSTAEPAAADARAAARDYLRLARDLLAPAPARLVAIGGFSGTGKSTLAAAIAPHLGTAPGARVLATDRLRKALFGVAAETRLPPAAYAPEVSEQVYAAAATTAAHIVGAGTAVVAEAVFDRPQDRARIAQAAAKAGVVFTGLWLEAAAETLLGRVGSRVGDASDATPEVVHLQLSRDPGALGGWVRLDAGQGAEAVAAAARAALGV